jgi:hypothetical protein
MKRMTFEMELDEVNTIDQVRGVRGVDERRWVKEDGADRELSSSEGMADVD